MSVAAERNALAKVAGRPVLRRREQWGSTFSYTGRWLPLTAATRVFIHISVTNPGNYNSHDAHARALEAIGRSRFPNTGVSYHRGFMAGAPSVYELQPIWRQGAHTVNDFRRSTCTLSGCPGRGQPLTAPSWNLNVNGRAYVYASNVGFSVPDHVVDDMARAIVADYRAGFITWSAAHNFHGHRCVSAKSCPGDRMWSRMGDLHTLIHRYRDNGLPGTSTSPPPSTGGSVTITQDDAREVWRFKNERLTDRDAYSFLREVERIYARVNDRIAYNAWMQARWPDDRSDGWTPRTYWRNGYGHAKRNTETIEGTVIPLLQEIKAAQGGAARDEVLADIQATLAEARQERQAIGDRLDDLLAGHELMRAEVQAALSGEKDAADALRALAAILNAALEES